MIRRASVLLAVLLATPGLRAGELDDEFGPRATAVATANDAAPSAVVRPGVVRSSELDAEAPAQSCLFGGFGFGRGFGWGGGYGLGGWGGYGIRMCGFGGWGGYGLGWGGGWGGYGLGMGYGGYGLGYGGLGYGGLGYGGLGYGGLGGMGWGGYGLGGFW